MSAWTWVGVGLGAALVLALLVLGATLLVLGRAAEARALARFVPDCAILFARLLRDPRVARRRKLVLALMLAYLANPLDLLPGSALDDALIAALVLRYVLRGSGALVEEHWPGPPESLAVLLRLSVRRQEREALSRG